MTNSNQTNSTNPNTISIYKVNSFHNFSKIPIKDVKENKDSEDEESYADTMFFTLVSNGKNYVAIGSSVLEYLTNYSYELVEQNQVIISPISKSKDTALVYICERILGRLAFFEYSISEMIYKNCEQLEETLPLNSVLKKIINK